MISWVWVPIVAIVSAGLTMIAMSCCVVAGNADRQSDRIEWPEYPK